MNFLRYQVTDEVAAKMLRRAQAALAHTYPTAQQGYAATVLTASGELYDGVSYNSDTQTLTMHGEMTAMAHAAIHGQKDVVAITGPNCHICKQLIWESALRSGYDIQIILKQEGVVRRVPISNLMQYPWPDAQGRH
jgi:cytidine deaminase